jgi:hypothetical protein
MLRPEVGFQRLWVVRPISKAEQQPCSALLEQIRRLKLPAVDAATANRLLGPFVREALKFDERSTLLGIVQQFGWVVCAAPPSAAAAAGSAGGEFSRSIDLLEEKELRNPCLRQRINATKVLIYG